MRQTDINGCFDEVPDEAKEVILEVVANYHYRNGAKHDDGSMGDIKITNRQLNDCLAYIWNRR